ncbi:MAG: hypothetical protein IPK19_05595 [Chloroflexi bacterium]|nr:hypothetical protein [Chloroflexota bacterium]
MRLFGRVRLILVVLSLLFSTSAAHHLAAQSGDSDPSAAGTYLVTGAIPANVRYTPTVQSAVTTTLPPGTTIEVVAAVRGQVVFGSTVWYEFLWRQQPVYIHSSLAVRIADASPTPMTPTEFLATTVPPTAPVPTATAAPTTAPTQLPTSAIEGASASVITANPNASYRAQQVLAYMYSLNDRSDSRVISGQFGAYGEGTGRDTAENQLLKIYDQAALWPALTGMDYARWDRRRAHDFSEPNGFLIDQWRMNSLINISWHAPNPWTGGGSTDWENPNTENPWDTRDVTELTTPGTAVHTEWLLMLDDIAGGLQQLQQAGVVVIWRPLHEMNGGWAWWHRQEPASYVALWRHMFDYFTHVKGLNNLLWAYSPNANTNEWDPLALYFYPGDQYVDLVGLDKYMALGEDPLALNNWNEYEDLVSTGKPVALFEFGPLPATGAGWDTVEYDYSHLIRDIRTYYPEIILFQAWEYIWQIGNHQNASGLLNDPWVITRDELPDWDRYRP